MRILKIGTKIVRFMFSKEGHIVGLMVLWRWLWRTLVYGGPVFLICWGISELFGADNSFEAAKLPFNIIMLFVWLFILNAVGKIIALKRYQKPVSGFIGWSIFWRELIYRIILLFPFLAVYIVGVELVPGLEILFRIIFILCIVYCAILTYGYAVRRALEIYAGIPLASPANAANL